MYIGSQAVKGNSVLLEHRVGFSYGLHLILTVAAHNTFGVLRDPKKREFSIFTKTAS